MIIPANQPIPFSADYGASGLNIGAKVFDCSSGSPVQLTGRPGQTSGVYPLSNVAGSFCYLFTFSGLPQHSYLVLIQAYTDNAFTIVDISKPEFSESVSAKILAPLITYKLKIELGCENQPPQRPVIVAQNSDANIVLSFFDEDRNPIDITSATELEIKMMEHDNITVLIKELGAAISLIDGHPNQVLLEMRAADFEVLPGGDNDISVTLHLAGSTYVINLYDAINVEPDVTEVWVNGHPVF